MSKLQNQHSVCPLFAMMNVWQWRLFEWNVIPDPD